ncbi:LysR substrate-binding domain-containing protein [Methylobacterium organophilum]|uniref:LysR substrate-binding domain-containing protein n=1 Tax=Methylobacterium organophilum TaxID=410 RepID=UPI001EE1A598|nr:LysR substrate-binding domain-containing protein [Methylobacterium organophilum]
MVIEIRHVRAFLAVASELHFGRAANQLNIAQPALSRTIQNLEAILGVQLLERSTRSVQLTPAGQLFRDQFGKLMRQMKDAVQATQRMGRGETGLLSVAYADAALCGPMPEIIRRFRRDNPNAKLELTQGSPETVLQLLADRRIDCGFLPGPVRDVRLDARCIHSDLPVVVMPVSHRLSLKTKLTLADLARERFVTCGGEGWENLQRLCLKAGFLPQLHQEVPHQDALLAFVAAEAGIGVCPAGVQMSARSGVVIRPLVETPLSFDLHCAWHRENTSRIVVDFAALVARFAAGQGSEPAAMGRVHAGTAS